MLAPGCLAASTAVGSTPSCSRFLENVWPNQLPQGFRAVEPAVLGKKGKTARACEDARCALEKLGGVEARRALRAEVARLGETLYVQVQLLDLSGGTVMTEKEHSCGAKEELLAKAIGELSQALLGSEARAAASARPLSDAPRRASLLPEPQTTVLRVENQNKKRALYACLGARWWSVPASWPFSPRVTTSRRESR